MAEDTHLSADLERRLRALREDGWRADGPELEVNEIALDDLRAEVVQWRMTLSRPGEQPLKGRGRAPEGAVEAAVARAEAVASG